MNDHKLIGYGAAVISTVLLGTLGIFVRNIEANGYVITFARVGVGFIGLALFLILRGQWRSIRLSQCSWSLVISGVLLATTSLCYINAVSHISLANAVFLLYLGPLFAVGLAAIFLKERFTVFNAILISAAFLGFLCLLEFNLALDSVDWIGYLWGIGAGLCYALYVVFNRHTPIELPALTRSFYQLFFGTLTMIPFLDASIMQLSSADMLWLLALGIMHGAIAFSLIIVAVKYLKAAEYGTISYVEPLIASCIGFFFFAEHLTWLQIVGCCIIVSGGLTQVMFAQKKI